MGRKQMSLIGADEAVGRRKTDNTVLKMQKIDELKRIRKEKLGIYPSQNHCPIDFQEMV